MVIVVEREKKGNLACVPPLDVPSNLRRGHFVSTAAAAHKKTRPLTMEPEFN